MPTKINIIEKRLKLRIEARGVFHKEQLKGKKMIDAFYAAIEYVLGYVK